MDANLSKFHYWHTRRNHLYPDDAFWFEMLLRNPWIQDALKDTKSWDTIKRMGLRKMYLFPDICTNVLGKAEKRSATQRFTIALTRAWNAMEEFLGGLMDEDRLTEASSNEIRTEIEDIFRDVTIPIVPMVEEGVDKAQRMAGDDKVVAFDFDNTSQNVKDFLDNYRFGLIRALTDEQTKHVSKTIAEGLADGASPAELARKIRDRVGLTPIQSQHVENYRAQLENLDPASMKRELRDKRYDRSVKAAIENKEPLSDEQIDKMVGAYKRKYLGYRATTIARTESLRAANMGQQLGIKQMVEQGKVSADRVVKEWMATKDSRTRDMHRMLDGSTVRGLDTPFVVTDPKTGDQYTIRYPHDPKAPANMTANCRCTMSYSILPKVTDIADPLKEIGVA